MKYQLTESAKHKYLYALGVLTFSGILPMLLAGIWIEMAGL